jgi:hypothetical protein
MGDLRKITVQVPEEDLDLAQIQAQRDLLKLRGKVKFSMTLEELRYDRE